MDIGLTAGFGGTLGPDLLKQIKAHGYTCVRNGDDKTTDPAHLRALMNELIALGIRPILGEITVAQVPLVPEGVKDVELRPTPDLTKNGLEPGFTLPPKAHAEALNAAVPMLKAKGLQAWVGMYGTNASDLDAWKIFVDVLDPVFGLSIHRYPPKNATSWTASYLHSRDDEAQQFRAISGMRPFAVCEVGYSQTPQAKWWQRLFGYHWHLTDVQRRACLEGELAYWKHVGAEFVCVFQFNDGLARCPRHPWYPLTEGYGARRCDGSWKP